MYTVSATIIKKIIPHENSGKLWKQTTANPCIEASKRTVSRTTHKSKLVNNDDPSKSMHLYPRGYSFCPREDSKPWAHETI